MSDKTCSSCRYWVRLAEGNVGDCRKNPPFMVKEGYPYCMRIWPNTYDIDWCGEHKLFKENKKKKED